jgi:membrane-bound metal-dependent hydrolase YbcI (DUF457 family)
MNTPSHLIITAALDKGLSRVPIHRPAFLWGSIAPDLPLWILSLGGMIYYRFILGWSMRDTFNYLFDELYFHDPLWMSCHNFLHSPVIIGLGIVLVANKRQWIGSRQRWLFWFFGACLLHSTIDIFTHADDGPLLLFPLEWSFRFNSPISYWDPRHYGREFSRFEFVLNGLLLIYLFKTRMKIFWQWGWGAIIRKSTN